MPISLVKFPFRFQLIALMLATLAIIWGTAAWVVDRDRVQTIEVAQTRLVSLARAFGEHALSTIQRVDSLLLTLRQRWTEDPRGFSAEVERQQSGLADFATLVGIIDANGMVVFNSQSPDAKPIFSGDRDYYRALRESSDDSMVIGTPILGRISKKWSFPLSRKIDPTGPFAGVVFISIDPAYYSRFYDSLELKNEGVVAMVSKQGDVLARHPLGDTFQGTRITGTPYLDPNPSLRGSYRRVAQTDGVERLFGYYRLPLYGTTLIVGEPMASVMAQFRQRTKVTWTGAAVLSILLALLFLNLYRSAAAREANERATQVLNQELEQRVQERTAQLSAANKQLEAFGYSVAHDLRAPLRGIDGYSSLLLEDFGEKLGDTGRQYIENVRKGTAQMNELISDLLAYSHLEQQTLEKRDIQLQGAVAALVAEFHPGLTAASIACTNQVPDLIVSADPVALKVALRNLLDNAIKFTRNAANPSIGIAARDNGTFIQIWVKDNGPGFDMIYHDQIFEIFKRLNRAEDYPGTGIGLAIVRKAMERMGGRAWAESEPGKGACFWLEFPK